MAIDSRTVTLIAQIADAALTNIPLPPVKGQAYRDKDLTVLEMENGDRYDSVFDSAKYNQIMFVLSGLLRQVEQFGILPYSEETNYSQWGFCLGLDGGLYQAVLESGPGTTAGPQPTSNANYWLARSFVTPDRPTGYATEFRTFFERVPPPGWRVRNGGVLYQSDTDYPDLWAALQTEENLWKCVTEEQWQDMSRSDPWNGVGGVPFFVLDTAAKTVRLPDTRGMYMEDAGFDGLTVGGVHGDAIRNITAQHFYGQDGDTYSPIRPTGAFKYGPMAADPNNLSCFQAPANAWYPLILDPSLVVPTASVNRPKAFGVLGCVYVSGDTKASGTYITEAPVDGQAYARKGGGWAPINEPYAGTIDVDDLEG